MLFGTIVGGLIVLSVREPQRLFPGSLTGLISAATTIVVGWWIHGAVRRRGELDRIPIEYLSALNQRIDKLIAVCLRDARGRDDEYISNFARLSNEVHWLGIILENVRPDLKTKAEELAAHFVEFKRCLTAETMM